jgi:DNA polymerase-1
MSEEQARRHRDKFFSTYPGLRRWQRRTAELAEWSHSVKTPSGRVRTWKRERGRSHFTAFLNTPIQGGAAEVLQAALASLDRRLKSLDAQVTNVVHDEIILEVAPQDVDAAKLALEAAMVDGMVAVFPAANVGGLVEAHSGENWAAAKP